MVEVHVGAKPATALVPAVVGGLVGIEAVAEASKCLPVYPVIYIFADLAAVANCFQRFVVSRRRPSRTSPWVSFAFLVMMLMTPLTALAPHSVPPGPRITSIRSTSSKSTFCTFQ